MHIAHINLAKGFRGGERQTALLIEELAQRNITQTLICRDDSPLRSELKHIISLNFRTANNHLSGHLHAINADIMHAHEAKAVHFASIENKIRKTPFIITRRVPNLPSDAALKIYKRAASIVAVSNAVKNILNNCDVQLSIDVIHSAFIPIVPEIANVEQIRQRFPNKIIIGHIGALSCHHKGQDYLIAAAKELNKRYENLVFLFIGEGKDEEYLKELAKGEQNIYFLGFKKNICEYIAVLDLFIFPSLEEGLGSTLLDVMQLGVPIIATDVGGIPDIIIHNETGVLIKHQSSKEIENAVVNYINASEHYKQLASQARNYAEKFSTSAMASKYFAIYEGIIDSNK